MLEGLDRVVEGLGRLEVRGEEGRREVERLVEAVGVVREVLYGQRWL